MGKNLTKFYRKQALRDKCKGINRYFQDDETVKKYEAEFPFKCLHCERRYRSKKERENCVCMKERFSI